MKKILRVLILLFMVVSISTVSMAADAVASVSLVPDATTVEPGKEVKVRVDVNDFTREGTNKAIELKLEYDNTKLQYKSSSISNGWSGFLSSDGTALVASKFTELSKNETVAEIIFTVNEDAELGNATIKATEIITSSDGDEVEVANAEVTIEIKKVEQGGTGDEEGKDDGEGEGGQEGDGQETVVLSEIKITQVPTKTSYKVGEKFDTKGMILTAVYSDGTTKEITDYTYAPNGELTLEDKIITISYTEGETTKTVTQAITVEKKETNKNEEPKDPTTSDKTINNAGLEENIATAIIIIVVISIVFYKKYKKFSGIE